MDTIAFRLNGTDTTVSGDPEKPLLWVLREDFSLYGTKFGCGTGACGACTVLLDQKAVRSCRLPVGEIAGREVITIEGVTEFVGPYIQKAWLAEDVSQCGYCQTGMITATAALLLVNPEPDDAAINAAITNICRCGAHVRIRRAIKTAAQMMKGGGEK